MGGASDETLSPLPAWARFYFYALHGLFDEIVFTAIFDSIFDSNGNFLQLKGYSTIYSFFMYGSCSFFVERVYVWSQKVGMTRWVRVPLYLLILYTWELCWGLVLRQFNACSWDYSHYRYNFLGLITLEYAPCWLILCFWQDVLSKYMLSLRIKLDFTVGAHDKLN